MATRMLVFFGHNNHRAFSGFTPEAMDGLKKYSWPGNLRELRNTIERIAIFCKSEIVGKECIPEKILGERREPPPGRSDEPLQDLRKSISAPYWPAPAPCRRRRKSSASTRRPSGENEKTTGSEAPAWPIPTCRMQAEKPRFCIIQAHRHPKEPEITRPTDDSFIGIILAYRYPGDQNDIQLEAKIVYRLSACCSSSPPSSAFRASGDSTGWENRSTSFFEKTIEA